MNLDNKNTESIAAYYLTCMNDGFTKQQEEQFNTWLCACSENKKVFEKVRRTQNMFASISYDVKKEISKSVYEELETKKINSNYNFKSFLIAASLLIVICLGVFQTNRYLNFQIERQYLTTNSIQIITLPDGSKLTLDAKTSVSINYLDNKRLVSLKNGNAIFDVVRDVNRPFVIDTEEIKVKVLGTSFEIKNQKDNLEVNVISGLVSILEENHLYEKELVKLTKGKKISYEKKSATYTIGESDIKTIALWKDGFLTFKDSSLKEAIEQFNKYNSLNVFLEKEIENLSVTGVFNIEQFDKFLFAITQIHSIKTTKSGKKTFIYKKK